MFAPGVSILEWIWLNLTNLNFCHFIFLPGKIEGGPGRLTETNQNSKQDVEPKTELESGETASSIQLELPTSWVESASSSPLDLPSDWVW